MRSVSTAQLSSLAAVRYVRIRGLEGLLEGDDDGFDLDAVGAIHYDTCLREPEVVFRRGDANDDRRADLSDAVFTLNWLFLDGATPGRDAGLDRLRVVRAVRAVRVVGR